MYLSGESLHYFYVTRVKYFKVPLDVLTSGSSLVWLTFSSCARCQTSTPCSNSCQREQSPPFGGEGAVGGLSELSATSPEPMWSTVSNLIWLRKHRFNVFCLSIFSSSFFLSCSHYCFLLRTCFIFASLDFHLCSFVAQPFHIFSSWPLFCVFDTVLRSFVVSSPSLVPPELISLSQVIIFFLLWIRAPLFYPALVAKVS